MITAIYARQSVDKKDSISIETQIEQAKALCEGEIKVYKDKGFSGKNTDRPKFQELMQDIERGIIKRVVVYKLDRISRSILDFGGIMEELNKHKVDFISKNEQFDTSTPIGRAVLMIIMIFAQLERETIQARVKDNYYAMRKHGFAMPNITVWGYIKEPCLLNGKKNHTYTINETKDNAPLIRQIGNKYANDEDATLHNISKELNESGDYDLIFSHTKIQRLLKNPFYVRADVDIYNYLLSKKVDITSDISEFNGINGIYLYGDRKNLTCNYFSDEALALCKATVGSQEGVFDSATWLKIQAKMDRKRKVINRGKGTKSYIQGLMFCEHCGRTIYLKKGGAKGNETFYFYCAGRRHGICDGLAKTYRADETEQYVEQEILNYMESLKGIKAKKREVQENPQINIYKAQIIKLDEEIKNLIEGLSKANGVAMEYINEKIAELDTKKVDFHSKINSLIVEKDCPSVDKVSVEEIINNFSNLDVEGKKDIARVLIKQIIVRDADIDVKFT